MIFKRKAQIDLNKSTLNLNIAPIAKNPIQIPLPSLPDSISIPHETFENSSEMHTKEHVLSAKIQEKEKSNMKVQNSLHLKLKWLKRIDIKHKDKSPPLSLLQWLSTENIKSQSQYYIFYF